MQPTLPRGLRPRLRHAVIELLRALGVIGLIAIFLSGNLEAFAMTVAFLAIFVAGAWAYRRGSDQNQP